MDKINISKILLTLIPSIFPMRGFPCAPTKPSLGRRRLTRISCGCSPQAIVTVTSLEIAAGPGFQPGPVVVAKQNERGTDIQ